MRHSWSEKDENGIEYCLKGCGTTRYTVWERWRHGRSQPYLQYCKDGNETDERPECQSATDKLKEQISNLYTEDHILQFTCNREAELMVGILRSIPGLIVTRENLVNRLKERGFVQPYIDLSLKGVPFLY